MSCHIIPYGKNRNYGHSVLIFSATVRGQVSCPWCESCATKQQSCIVPNHCHHRSVASSWRQQNTTLLNRTQPRRSLPNLTNTAFSSEKYLTNMLHTLTVTNSRGQCSVWYSDLNHGRSHSLHFWSQILDEMKAYRRTLKYPAQHASLPEGNQSEVLKRKEYLQEDQAPYESFGLQTKVTLRLFVCFLRLFLSTRVLQHGHRSCVIRFC